MRTQHFQFLATAAEHERVAALEPDHATAGAGVFQHQRMDVFLRHAVAAGGLADLDQHGVGMGQGQHARAHQAVVQHHLGRLQRPHRMQGEQARVARARADQGHAAGRQVEGRAGGGRG